MTDTPEVVCDRASRLLAAHVKAQSKRNGRVFDPVALHRATKTWWEGALDEANGDHEKAAALYEQRVVRHVGGKK